MITGYRRSDGSVGFRNHLLVIPTVGCSNQVCARIAAQVEGAVAIPHQHGCSQVGSDANQTFRTLAGMGHNPNVGAVIVVSLGCEVVVGEELTQAIAKTGKPAVFLRIQEVGGSIRTIERGIEEGRKLSAHLSQMKREPVSLADITLGVKCGRPDQTVGAANRALGEAVDAVIQGGGTVLAGETAILAAGRDLLAPRMKDPAQLDRLVEGYEGGLPLMHGGRPAQPPILEEPFDALSRTGTAPIEGTTGYACRPPGKGLWLMDTPLSDAEALSSFAAGGANLIAFATGTGTPVGSAIAPVIKITANAETARLWADNMDVNIAAGESVLAALLAAAGGDWTKSEVLGHDEFAINRVGLSL